MRHISLEGTPPSENDDSKDLRETKTTSENEKDTNTVGTLLDIKERQEYIRQDEDFFAVMLNGGF